MKKNNLFLSKNRLLFFFTFGFSKGITFLGPLLLADILSEEDFGVLEYALAGVGMLVNSMIDLGASGGYPYVVLKNKDKKIAKGFVLHGIWLNLFFLINQLLYFQEIYFFEIYMSLNISYVISNQLFYASKLKTHDKINSSAILNSGIYIVLFVFILGAFTDLFEVNVKSIGTGIFCYAILLFSYNILQFIKVQKKGLLKAYYQILKFSIHILVSSILLFAITVSGRILVEYFFDFNQVAVYGFYFRLAAISVMIYQVVAIMFFKKIYTSAPNILDKYFTYFFLSLLILSFILDFTAPFIVPYFSDFYVNTSQENSNLFTILIFQMIMWISTALNSNIIDREKLSQKNNYRLLALFIIGLGLLAYLRNSLSVESLTFVIYSFFFLTTLTQYFTLSKEKIFFKKSIITIVVIYFISVVYIYLI